MLTTRLRAREQQRCAGPLLARILSPISISCARHRERLYLAAVAEVTSPCSRKMRTKRMADTARALFLTGGLMTELPPQQPAHCRCSGSLKYAYHSTSVFILPLISQPFDKETSCSEQVRDGWEAFGPLDQRALARAYLLRPIYQFIPSPPSSPSSPVCVCARVRACVRVCVRACVRACVRCTCIFPGPGTPLDKSSSSWIGRWRTFTFFSATPSSYKTDKSLWCRVDGNGRGTFSYLMDLEKMTQVNLGSRRERKLRRLPAGRSPDAVDAAAGSNVWSAVEPEPSPEGWVAGEGGEQEVVGDVDGRTEREPELVLLSSTASVTNQPRNSTAPR